MNQQYAYPGIQGQQLYNKNTLTQYQTTVNPLDPLGLKGTQYIVADPSLYSQNYQNKTQAYANQIPYGQPSNNIRMNNNIAQLQNPQKQINQPISKNQQIYAQNNINQVQHQKMIQPQIQNQKQVPIQHHHHHQNQNQKVQPQVQAQMKPNQPQRQVQQPQIQQPQMQQQYQQKINQKQKQPYYQQQVNPQIKPKHQSQNQIQKNVQPNSQGNILFDPNYQKYIQRPNQNIDQNTKIPYNKNDAHFVNKPIYDKPLPSNPLPAQNKPKQIKTLDQNPTLVKGTKIIDNNNINNKSGMTQKIEQNIYTTKKNNNLSSIKEEEISIKESGLSKNISRINQSNIKESPMEEKLPETAFPDNIRENTPQQSLNITQKSVTQSGLSDYDNNMSHLPTINSIMRGSCEPLPPLHKNKYGNVSITSKNN